MSLLIRAAESRARRKLKRDACRTCLEDKTILPFYAPSSETLLSFLEAEQSGVGVDFFGLRFPCCAGEWGCATSMQRSRWLRSLLSCQRTALQEQDVIFFPIKCLEKAVEAVGSKKGWELVASMYNVV